MKKLTSTFAIAGIVFILASCQKASEKAAGTYTGNYTIGTAYSGNTIVTTVGDAVNMALNCTSMGISSTASNVTVALSGENVTFTYNSTTTTSGEVISISGSLTGNSLSYNFVISLGGTNSYSGSFLGSK